MSAIELKDVSFSYDGTSPVLSGVNFAAEYGEVCLISGHSGEGKSTLMYIMSGVIPNVNYGRLSGEVLVDGEDIKGKKIGDICRKVGIVLQNADEQIIQKTVEDEIAFACENLAFPPQKTERQIEIVCRLMKLDRGARCRLLSGGQKQRLITASTLAMGQRIIILDEPLANLDKEGAAHLMGTLRSLAAAGYSVIVIEHRLDMVLPYVDRVWHMGGGCIAEVEDKDAYLTSQTAQIADICPAFAGGERLISVHGVTFTVRGGRTILQDVNLEVPRGGRVVLLGENGCGKTTLMRMIARLNRLSGGTITQTIDKKLGGRRGSRAWYRAVGVVYQNPDYQLFMPTVRREIYFGAQSHEYADHIAELFGLKGLYERHPQSLSEGQKRKLSIAAVLATRPKLLLLDEPTVGQDYDGLCNMTNILNGIHAEEGNTMITVTHDVRCAEALCDTAYFIEGGRAAACGGKELVRAYFGGQDISPYKI